MFNTLLLKEIQETIYTLRFSITALLCLILIPLGLFVSMKDYQHRLEEYQNSVQKYLEYSEGKLGLGFQAEGYRPPSSLSIFSFGLRNLLPEKVITNNSGNFEIIYSKERDNPQAVLFGKIDFVFIVSFVLSILALILTFSSVTQEKELGTIRLVMANNVPRWQIILAKVLGNYLVFLGPFLISFLLALIILLTSGVFNPFSPEIFPNFIALFIVTIIFLFAMFNLGIFISTMTRNSILSMVVLLLVWIILGLAMPKISPMIAEVVYPIRSREVVDKEIRMLRDNYEKELQEKERGIIEDLLSGRGITQRSGDGFWGILQSISEEYGQAKAAAQDETYRRRDLEIAQLEQSYLNDFNRQTTIGMSLSRISPMCCYTVILSELSGTGSLETSNFREYAKRFQETVNNEIYDNYTYQRYSLKQGSVYSTSNAKDGFNAEKLTVPQLSSYRHVTFSQVFQKIWVDIFILCLFTIIFFVAGFVSFIKYDVR